MDYLEVVKKSAKLTWGHKSMWFFGILIAFLSGGSSNVNYQYMLQSEDFTRGTERYAQMDEILRFLLKPQVIVAIVLLFFIILVAGIVLQYLSRGALIGMVDDIEMSGETGVGQGFKHGWRSWLSLYGISIFIWLPFGFVLIFVVGLLSLPVILAFVKNKVALGFTLLFLSILLFLIFLFLVVVPLILTHAFAERFCVLDKRRLFESIGEGYHLFRANFGSVLLMWLLLVTLNIVLITVIGIFTALIMLPIMLGLSSNSLLAIVLLVPIALVLVFVGGIYRVFIYTVWTLFFKKLKEPVAVI